MNSNVISVEHLSKQYDLGVIGTGTISRDLNRWWARMHKQPDPYTRVGQKDPFESVGESILALYDVSFKVQQGETLGIIGRNGAGKSTLLKILSRVTAPTSGEVKVKGRIGSLLEVGTGFHPELTGRENVYLNGAILGMKKTEVTRKFDEIVDFSGVEKFIDTPVKRYSSGMYVRLAFAVAAHLDPEILIVDEVLAVGDAEFQKKCLGKMGDVAGQGRTVLFVSHNLTAISTLCSRTILLNNGGLLKDGDSGKIIEDYIRLNDTKVYSSIDGTIDLTSHVNQYGSPAIITGIKLAGLNGESRSSFFMNESFNIIVQLDNFSSVRNGVLGLIIKNELDQWMTSMTSSMRCLFKDEKRSRQELAILKIDSLPLMPGTYWIDLSISQKGSGRVDYVDRAAKLVVEETDVYGTGHRMTKYFGIFYLDAGWEIKND